MEIVRMDEKGRIQLTKKLREELELKPMEALEASVKDTTITIRPFKVRKISRRQDPLDWLLSHPAHVDKKKLKKINLEKLEDEAWTP